MSVIMFIAGLLIGAIVGVFTMALAVAARDSDDKMSERETGYWIPSDTDGFVCSICRSGYRNQPTLMGKPMFEFCPICRAEMKGE